MKRVAMILMAALFLCGCSATGTGKESSILLDPSSAASSTPSESSVPPGSEGPSAESVPQTSSITVTPTVEAPSKQPDKFDSLSNKKSGWGQGLIVNEKNQPVSCPQYNSKYGKYDAVFMGTNESNIYLTFDEGYENGYTSAILDTLKAKQVSAVFFVTYDYVRTNPDLVKRMINEGHIVGNHTWSHPSLPEVSDAKVVSEITKLHDYVKAEFNYTMTLMRPPMGEFSERTLAITRSLGYKTIFWSFAYMDYDTKNQPVKAKAFERVTSAAHGGAVYLLHAVSKVNTEMLGDVIDNFREKGFKVAEFDI